VESLGGAVHIPSEPSTEEVWLIRSHIREANTTGVVILIHTATLALAGVRPLLSAAQSIRSSDRNGSGLRVGPVRGQSVERGGLGNLVGGEASGSEHSSPLEMGSHSGLGDVEGGGQLLLGAPSLVGSDQLVDALRAQAVLRVDEP